MELVANKKERLDKFLADRLPTHSRSKLAKLIDSGMVLVNGKPEKPGFRLEKGMVVALGEPPEAEPHDLTPADIPLDVLYEDDVMMIVSKPRGLAVHPAASLKEPSLVNALLARGGTLSEAAGSFRPGIVHRLDKDTTGILVIAKTDAAHAALAKQIESKTAERRYFAVVAGKLDQETFTINAPIARDHKNRQKMAVDARGKVAISHVRFIHRLDQGSLVAVRLETGRTHQIRVHFRAIGHPVLGDSTYAPREFQGVPLQLHAAYLELDHPQTGERLGWYAPPPDDFLGCDVAEESHVRDF